MKPFNRTLISIFALGIILDQITKLWAEARFTYADGTPNGEVIEVIGSLFRFQLAYNTGAAFSMKPQALVPWLHPTLFFAIVSIIAIIALWKFFKSLPINDWASRLGVIMILSGAIGTFTDRIRIGKVVDFIDWDFPDFTGEDTKITAVDFEAIHLSLPAWCYSLPALYISSKWFNYFGVLTGVAFD